MKKCSKIKYIALTLVVLASAGAHAAHRRLNSVYIAGAAMEPTFVISDLVPYQKNAYENISQVQRGDIIVFKHNDNTLVRRVLGLPGDKVQLSGTEISVNGKPFGHEVVATNPKHTKIQESSWDGSYRVQYETKPDAPTLRSRNLSVTVPAGKLFVLADNRDNSLDSRYFGAVPFEKVVGKQ